MYHKWQKSIQEASLAEGMIWTSVVMIVFLFVLYLYFLNATVMNVAQKRSVSYQYDQVTGQVSGLEFRYITLNSKLDIAYAKTLGYHRVETPHYTRRPQGLALTTTP